jgi:hypothetical protein
MTKKELDGAIKLQGLLETSGLPYLIRTVTCVSHKNFCACSFFVKMDDFYEWKQFLKYNNNFVHWFFSPINEDFPCMLAFHVEFELKQKTKNAIDNVKKTC